MKKSARMQVVVNLAEHQQDKLGRLCAEQQRVHADAVAKLRQLENYQDEYRVLASAGSGRFDINRLQAARQFLVKLADAIAFQREEVGRLEGLVVQARQLWLAARQRQQQLGTLVEGYRRDELAHDERRDQQRADELAGQRHERRLRQTPAEH